MNRITIILAAIVVAGAAYVAGEWRGYAKGYAAAEQAQQDAREQTQSDLFAIGEGIRAKADALRAANAERATQEQEILDEIRNDPDAARPGISDAGMRRLERAFSSP